MASRLESQNQLRRSVRNIKAFNVAMWVCVAAMALGAPLMGSVPGALFAWLGACVLCAFTWHSVCQDKHLLREAQELIDELDTVTDEQWDAALAAQEEVRP